MTVGTVLLRRGGEHVAHRVDSAALPAGTSELAADRGDEASVGVGDDELHALETALVEVARELGPERLVLRVAQVDTEDFSTAVAAQSGGDHDRFGHDMAVLSDMDVGGIEPHVEERLMTRRASAQHRLLREIAEGETKRDSMRCVERRISDAVWRQLDLDVETDQSQDEAWPRWPSKRGFKPTDTPRRNGLPKLAEPVSPDLDDGFGVWPHRSISTG